MLTCPRCGSNTWDCRHRCPIDPANDRFYCRQCGLEFNRYDPPQEKKKNLVDNPEDDSKIE